MGILMHEGRVVILSTEGAEMASDDPVEFEDCRAIKATKKALLVEVPGHDEIWFPHSHIHDNSSVYKEKDRGQLVVTEWIAEQKGLL